MCGPMNMTDEYSSQALAAEILCNLIEKQSVAFLELSDAKSEDGAASGIRRINWEEVKKGFREIHTAVCEENHSH